LQAVTQAIADGRGALVITSALAGLYLDPLRRILDARAAYDRARDLERTHDPRQARFACKDEQKFLNLIDQAARGIGNCLGLNGRVYLEAIAELTARGNSETPEALRRQHSQDFMLLNLYQQALLFKWDLPADFLQRAVGSQLELLNEEAAKGELQPSGANELPSSSGGPSKRRSAQPHNSPFRNDGGSENANGEIKR